MLNGWKLAMSDKFGRRTRLVAAVALVAAGAWSVGVAQQVKVAADSSKPNEVYVPIPGFDTTSLDTTVDPCNDFYKFACGKFAANHPIPADQSGVDQFYALYNVNTQALNGILNKAAAGGAGRSPDEQKIGDYYKACMDTDAINAKGLAPLEPLLKEIDAVQSRDQLPALIGKLQRIGVNAFFGYGEQQDFKDASKQIAVVIQGGLGLPEKDYYLRTGAKDVTIREQYVAHVAKMLELAGSTPEQAAKSKALYVKRYGRPETAAGWHFLTGQRPAIDAVTNAVGFGYVRVPGPDGKLSQFAHASSIEIVTPEGKLAQYYLGVEYSPKDMLLGLIDASGNKIGSPVANILTYCYHYDPSINKHSLIIARVVQFGGMITVAGLGGFMFLMFRKDVKLAREHDLTKKETDKG